MNQLIKSVATALSVATFAWASTATACTIEASARCQNAYHQTVNTICPLSFDPAACRQGALLSYSACMQNAGCSG
jgi:hypothetical protein